MTGSEKIRPILALAAVAALLIGAGCGGGSDDAASPSGPDSSQQRRTPEDGVAAARRKRANEAKPTGSRAQAKPGFTSREKKKAKGGGADPAASDRRQGEASKDPDDVAARVKELIKGDRGVQVVDSGRELQKVLREIKRSKKERDIPPLLEEVLEKARGS
jgi:hypothetical protein